MGLFEDLGRKVGEFTHEAKRAADEGATYACSDCGNRFYADRETCPECGSEQVTERETKSADADATAATGETGGDSEPNASDDDVRDADAAVDSGTSDSSSADDSEPSDSTDADGTETADSTVADSSDPAPAETADLIESVGIDDEATDAESESEPGSGSESE